MWVNRRTGVIWLLLLIAAVMIACQTDPQTATPTRVAGDAPTATTAPVTEAITAAATDSAEFESFLPLVDAEDDLPPTVTPAPDSAELPAPTPVPTPSVEPTIDFFAARSALLAEGQDLAFNKIGFHIGVGGNYNGLGTWMERLDEARVPFVLKSVDNAGPLEDAQELMAFSGVPHVLIFRSTGNDVPDYSLPPEQAAAEHWAWHRDRFPPELDRSQIWLETINELDKNRSEWVAAFALETARLATAEGFRWAAFGWAAGEPELDAWEQPTMLEFLRLAGENPDSIAIAMHEGSFTVDNIAGRYPFTIGRFLSLFDVADRNGIPRPTVLITEWGWEAFAVPDPGKALLDIDWAARLYAPFPQVKGAAIWYLGGGFEPIQDQAQRLIEPVTEYSLRTYFPMPIDPEQAPTDPDLYAP